MTKVNIHQAKTQFSRLVERAGTIADYTTEWRFTPDGAGTRVTVTTRYRPGGGLVGALLDRFLAQRRTRATLDQELTNLKSVLEAQTR